MESLGERIERLYKARSLTQDDVAKPAGVTREAVSLWSKRKVESIPSKCVLPIARLFRISVEELLTGVPDHDAPNVIDANLFSAALDEAEGLYRRTEAKPDTLQRVRMAISFYEEYIELRQGRAGRDLSDWEPPHPEP